MYNKQVEDIKLHVAGATVRHTSPFNELKTLKNDFELTQDFIDKWVIPYYIKIGRYNNEWIDILKSIKYEITPEIIQKNLGDFNWRTRQTGAFFAAITNQNQFIDTIGIHLLKSEVCFAGAVYCSVLTSFNTEKCVEYLNLYLDYYLTKPELDFDQAEAMKAILYLDKINNTNHFEKHLGNWEIFIKDKYQETKQINTIVLEKQLLVINSIKEYSCK